MVDQLTLMDDRYSLISTQWRLSCKLLTLVNMNPQSALLRKPLIF